eukprot:5574874-Prymnesium_polylepis.1
MSLLKVVDLHANIHALAFGPGGGGSRTLFCSAADKSLVALRVAAPADGGGVDVSAGYAQTTGIHRAVCEALGVSING